MQKNAPESDQNKLASMCHSQMYPWFVRSLIKLVSIDKAHQLHTEFKPHNFPNHERNLGKEITGYLDTNLTEL